MDSLQSAPEQVRGFLLASLQARSSEHHSADLKDLDEQAATFLLPILEAINSVLFVKQANLAALAKAQFVARKLRGIQASLLGSDKRIQLNTFIPTSLQRRKLEESVHAMIEHAESHLNHKQSGFFALQSFTTERYLQGIHKFGIKSPKSANICTVKDGWLPLRIYLKSLTK